MRRDSGLRPIVGLDDSFGARARNLRALQFRLLAIYAEAGFEEVIPPLLERPDTLASGAGRYLYDRTIIFSDPAGAGPLAIRPDITPQVARIAATRLQGESDLKLCYSGEVMLSRPDARTGSRQQWQTGVERIGVAGEEGDLDVMHLAAASMNAAGFAGPVLQVGHLGLLQALVADTETSAEAWVDRLKRRSPEDMRRLVTEEGLNGEAADALVEMAAGAADAAWLERNRDRFGDDFAAATDELLHLAGTVAERLSGEVAVQVDAAVMPRFLYHSGIVFAGYAAGVPQVLLFGGRYDNLMRAHGRDLPATGFSFDLWSWLDAGATA